MNNKFMYPTLIIEWLIRIVLHKFAIISFNILVKILLPEPPTSNHLREGSSCHLYTPLIRSIDLEVVPIGAMKSQEP